MPTGAFEGDQGKEVSVGYVPAGILDLQPWSCFNPNLERHQYLHKAQDEEANARNS